MDWVKRHNINEWIFSKMRVFRKSEMWNVKIELDLSHYATKLDLKNAAGVGWYIKLYLKDWLGKFKLWSWPMDKLEKI